MKPENMSCIDCTVKNCDRMDKAYPEFCPTVHMDQDVYQEAMECYKEEGNHKVMTAAAEVEYEHYCQYTRVDLKSAESPARQVPPPNQTSGFLKNAIKSGSICAIRSFRRRC